MAPPAPPYGGALRKADDLRATARAWPANRRDKPRDLLDELVSTDRLSREAAASVRRAAARADVAPADVLVNRRLATPADIAAAEATLLRVQVADLLNHAPDPQLLGSLTAARAIELGVAPWRRAGKATLIAAASREAFDAALPELSRHFDAPRLVIAPRQDITAAVARTNEAALVARAESRTAPFESCRTMGSQATLPRALLAGLLLALVALVAPTAMLALMTAWAVVTLAATQALKLAAALASVGGERAPAEPLYLGLASADLPRVSIMVALYKETDIAAHLVARLQRLNYPRERLEVLLVTESDDQTTQATLDHTSLPHWMRQITVPPGRVKTKPRALNYALDHCTGDIIGVYDAEDAPEPDQLLTVAAAFAKAAPDVACLQGRLDYYNPKANWLARCFALEYASWFRVVLPGLARLRLPVPLGGTTLFFRRDALRALGAWDAHNVTEDADLGLRLTRRGYRTELVETVTLEEANCRPWPWVRQRSRWLKGYAVTYAVHMRNPRALWRDLGPWGFLGVQLLFAGTLSQFLLAPVLISLWFAVLGFSHPVADLLSNQAMGALALGCVAAELCNWAVTALGSLRAKHGGLWPWIPTLMLYFPLGALAALKATYELFGQPFFWDKTSHGISMDMTPDLLGPLEATRPPRISDGSQTLRSDAV